LSSPLRSELDRTGVVLFDGLRREDLDSVFIGDGFREDVVCFRQGLERSNFVLCAGISSFLYCFERVVPLSIRVPSLSSLSSNLLFPVNGLALCATETLPDVVRAGFVAPEVAFLPPRKTFRFSLTQCFTSLLGPSFSCAIRLTSSERGSLFPSPLYDLVLDLPARRKSFYVFVLTSYGFVCLPDLSFISFLSLRSFKNAFVRLHLSFECAFSFQRSGPLPLNRD